MGAQGMEPFYVEIQCLGFGRWKWTGWDDGVISVATGVHLTEARAEAAARNWVRARYEARSVCEQNTHPFPSVKRADRR